MKLSEFIEREKTDPDIFWHQCQFEALDLLCEAVVEIGRLKAENAELCEEVKRQKSLISAKQAEHWDLAACPCYFCVAARNLGLKPTKEARG